MRRPVFRELLTAVAVCAAATGVNLVLPGSADAGRQVANTTRTSVNHNVNVNRSTNVNVNRQVDVDIDADRDWHPVAAAAVATRAAATTAVVVGSIVHALPPSCLAHAINGVIYHQCGATWYQPQYAGSTVQYVVIAPPR
jgi:hypothetical protein